MKRDYWPTRGWKTAAPAETGMRPDLVDAMGREIDSVYGSINGIVVVKGGRIVLEKYHGGYGPENAHAIFSVTKSVISMLIGIAIAEGAIRGADQKMLDFFPEYRPRADEPLKRGMTLRSLLTMTAPLVWRTGARHFEPMMDRMWRQKDWVPFILGLPERRDTPSRFQYNSAVSHLLSAILTRATGESAREYANKRLFGPLGIPEVQEAGITPVGGSVKAADPGNAPSWETDPQGNSTGGWGLSLAPRDMARLGWLYLNRGGWDGRQVVPAEWVDESTAPNPRGYGYQWWLMEAAGTPTYSAIGRGGHHIFCAPEKDLVVAVASKPAGMWRNRWPLFAYFAVPAAVS